MGLNFRNCGKPQFLVAIGLSLVMMVVAWAYVAAAASVATAVHEVLCKPYAAQYGFPMRALRWPSQLVHFNGPKKAAGRSRFVVAFHMRFSGRCALIPCVNGQRPDELMLGEYFNRAATRRASALTVRFRVGNVPKKLTALLPHLSALNPHTWHLGKKVKGGLELVVILVWKVSDNVKHYERHAERFVVFDLPAMAHHVGVGFAIGKARTDSTASLLVYFQNKKMLFQTLWPSETPFMLGVHWRANRAARKLADKAFAMMAWSGRKRRHEVRGASRMLASLPVEQAMLLAAGIVPKSLTRLPPDEIDALLVLAAMDRARYRLDTIDKKRRLEVAMGPLGFPLARYLVRSDWGGGKKIYVFAYARDAGAKFTKWHAEQTFVYSASGAIVAYLTFDGLYSRHDWYRPSYLSAGVLGLLPKAATRRLASTEHRANRGGR